MHDTYNIYIGQGYDIHATCPGNHIMLGGICISNTFGLLGHSDADVLLHAIMDAILGAARLGDIGEFFSNTDPSYKDISSQVLMHRVMSMISGYHVHNIDATVIAEQPKLASYKRVIIDNIKTLCKTDYVNIKATTKEGLDDTGKLKGIEAHAVVLLIKK